MTTLYTFVFIILLTCVIIELRYKPRLDTANGRKVIWYNVSNFSNERDFIYLYEKR